MSQALLNFLHRLVPSGSLNLRQGDYLFQPGDAATCLYGIEEGAIRMVRFGAEGQELVIYRAGRGETFAEAALFGDIYHCAVLAEVDSLIWTFPKEEILEVMGREPALLQRYSALLSRQVRDLRTLLEVRTVRAADERILYFLQLHADGTGCFQLSSTLMDLAGQLGLAHETLYRGLKKLEDAGEIKRDGQKIVLLAGRGVSSLTI